ncbi:MAG: hypothetical protein AAF827_15055, partial [Cyanobacteria bacterium P01_D01_bin.6]
SQSKTDEVQGFLTREWGFQRICLAHKCHSKWLYPLRVGYFRLFQQPLGKSPNAISENFAEDFPSKPSLLFLGCTNIYATEN